MGCCGSWWTPACALQALQDFEEVISLEPKNYLGDDFSRVTQIYRVAQYNLACCYAAINQAGCFLLCSLYAPMLHGYGCAYGCVSAFTGETASARLAMPYVQVG